MKVLSKTLLLLLFTVTIIIADEIESESPEKSLCPVLKKFQINFKNKVEDFLSESKSFQEFMDDPNKHEIKYKETANLISLFYNMSRASNQARPIIVKMSFLIPEICTFFKGTYDYLKIPTCISNNTTIDSKIKKKIRCS